MLKYAYETPKGRFETLEEALEANGIIRVPVKVEPSKPAANLPSTKKKGTGAASEPVQKVTFNKPALLMFGPGAVAVQTRVLDGALQFRPLTRNSDGGFALLGLKEGTNAQAIIPAEILQSSGVDRAQYLLLKPADDGWFSANVSDTRPSKIWPIARPFRVLERY